MNSLDLRVKKLHPDAKLPTKRNGDIGWDLYCVVDENFVDSDGWFWQRAQGSIGYDFRLDPGEQYTFKTGIACAIPDGYAGFIWDRSGLATKQRLHRLAGVIDSSYRGEWMVCLTNLGKRAYFIKPGDKIAQVIFQQEIPVQPSWVEELDDTERGTSGFGSTGA